MSVDFCDARQGGGAYGKTPATRPFYGSWPFAGLLLTCSFLVPSSGGGGRWGLPREEGVADSYQA
ncbi:hypothetical protein D2965_02595 [Veillonella atypica]|uniref:Uncharacterized protein n=1 Tax=Veillonella atypica TaxID=39777 RepID=A0A3A6WLW2_9FIRM|nr:hypothetical protein D2965_02595 [Veillonella atypica]